MLRTTSELRVMRWTRTCGRLRTKVRETIAAGPFPEAMVYMQITRGAGIRARNRRGAEPLHAAVIGLAEEEPVELALEVPLAELPDLADIEVVS